jgi:hypothetical protein
MNNLELKYKFYISEQHKVTDKYGFILSDECDSLLFTGLIGSIPEVEVYIDAAFDKKSGMWHRRPVEKPCYDCKNNKPMGSKSSISRDMLLGLAYYCYFNKRLDISEQIIKHALTHFGFMGKGALSRINIMPSLLGTFVWISYKLGGPSRPLLRAIPTLASKDVGDYQAHLAVLHALLRDKITGTTSKSHQKVYSTQANRNPENGLFQYAAGNIDKVYTILNNKNYFPEDRLPNRLDRSSPHLWERDYGKDYLPGDYSKNYPAADYLFLYWLVTNS